MNREIKFRAWIESVLPSETGMYYPTVMQLVGDGEVDKLWTNDYKFTSDTSKFTLMQYTGLTDKNGKQIYEGDIVNCSSGCPHVIEWTEVPTGAILGGGMPGFYFSGLNEGYAFLGSEEVVGNIYETPELLKK